jgi:hypothetical protein
LGSGGAAAQPADEVVVEGVVGQQLGDGADTFRRAVVPFDLAPLSGNLLPFRPGSLKVLQQLQLGPDEPAGRGGRDDQAEDK